MKFQLQNKGEYSINYEQEVGAGTNTVDLFSEIDSEINTAQHRMKL